MSAVLDTYLGQELARFQSDKQEVTEPEIESVPVRPPKPVRKRERAEVRRLSPLAQRALKNKHLAKLCCDGKCGLEDPRGIMISLVRAAQEVINGARPLNMLTRWLSAPAYEDLQKRLSVQSRSTRPSHRTVTITSSHVCRINHDTVEGTVILSDGGRVRAAVIRLEVFRGRWRASFLQTV